MSSHFSPARCSRSFWLKSAFLYTTFTNQLLFFVSASHAWFACDFCTMRHSTIISLWSGSDEVVRPHVRADVYGALCFWFSTSLCTCQPKRTRRARLSCTNDSAAVTSQPTRAARPREAGGRFVLTCSWFPSFHDYLVVQAETWQKLHRNCVKSIKYIASMSQRQ